MWARVGPAGRKVYHLEVCLFLKMFRLGVDIFTLQLLMGHADIQVLRRYLKQVNQDLLEIHRKASPADRF